MRAPIFRERIHSAVIGRFDRVDIADIVGRIPTRRRQTVAGKNSVDAFVQIAGILRRCRFVVSSKFRSILPVCA